MNILAEVNSEPFLVWMVKSVREVSKDSLTMKLRYIQTFCSQYGRVLRILLSRLARNQVFSHPSCAMLGALGKVQFGADGADTGREDLVLHR